MLKIRRPLGRLIFNMGIATLGKTVFLIDTAPCLLRSKIITADFANILIEVRVLFFQQRLAVSGMDK